MNQAQAASLQLGSHLTSRKVKQGWYIGRTLGAAFFARTRGELIFKYRQFAMNRKAHQIRMVGFYTKEGVQPTFVEHYGFGAGMRVYYHPVAGGPHNGRIYTIAITGYQSEGQPVVWLNGKAGCVSIFELSHAGGKVAQHQELEPA